MRENDRLLADRDGNSGQTKKSKLVSVKCERFRAERLCRAEIRCKDKI
jgi:hypothetical protein